MIDIKMSGNFTLRLRYFSGRVSAIGFVLGHILVAINSGDKSDWLNLPFSLSTGICKLIRLAVLLLVCQQKSN